MNIKEIKKQDDSNVTVVIEKIEIEERSLSNEQLIEQLKVLEIQYDNNVDEIKAIEDKNEEVSHNIAMIKKFIGVDNEEQEVPQEESQEVVEEEPQETIQEETQDE